MYGQLGVKYSYAVSMGDRSGRGERFGYVGKGLLEGVKALFKAIEIPIRLTQCCTQFKSSGVKILCVLYLPVIMWHSHLNVWKFLKQKVLFPEGLNWVQQLVSRIGLFNCN